MRTPDFNSNRRSDRPHLRVVRPEDERDELVPPRRAPKGENPKSPSRYRFGCPTPAERGEEE
jgi:hypothetical protein